MTLTQCIVAAPRCGWWACHAVRDPGSSAAEHAYPGEHSPFNASAMLLHEACSYVPLCCTGQPVPISSAGVPPGQLLPASSAGEPPGLPSSLALMTHPIALLHLDMGSSLGSAAAPITEQCKKTQFGCLLLLFGKGRQVTEAPTPGTLLGHNPANGTCPKNCQ